MQVFDASSMIYAWDNYPFRQFPGLWDWMSDMIEAKAIAMPRVAFDEVRGKAPECAEWLKGRGLGLIEIGNETLQEAMRIKGLLGIVDDNYHPKGVGENDLLIIATASGRSCQLVSDERRQTNPPDEPRKRKIPAVCAIGEVSVDCISFLEFIKHSEKIFR